MYSSRKAIVFSPRGILSSHGCVEAPMRPGIVHVPIFHCALPVEYIMVRGFREEPTVLSPALRLLALRGLREHGFKGIDASTHTFSFQHGFPRRLSCLSCSGAGTV